MNVFQLIKSVLDEEYAEIGGTDAEKDKKVKGNLDTLSSSYSKLGTKCPRVDYADPATRLGYVFRYVTCHTHLVAREIEDCAPLSKLLKQDHVTVSCVGGGPGSDFLGLLERMIASKSEATLRCYMLDGEPAWGDAWADVAEKLSDSELTFNVYTHFQQLDVTDTSTWLSQRKYLQADLFTMIYFVSEVYALNVGPFFDHLFTNAKSGAFFLYIDNDADPFTPWMESLAKKHGLKLVKKIERDSRLPSSEQKDDMEPYCKKFDGYPKLKARMACRVYQKP